MGGTPGPEATCRIGGSTIRLIGTIGGYAPDAARVEQALGSMPEAAIALAVTEADLEGLARLAAAADPQSLISAEAQELDADMMGTPGLEGIWDDEKPRAPAPPSDGLFHSLPEHDQHFLAAITDAGFGDTRIPSPDLETAHGVATAAERPIHAIDLDDDAHSDLFTKLIGVRGLVQRGRSRAKALALEAAAYSDAYAFAIAFDAAWNKPKGLAAIEVAREAHMADRLRALAADVDIVAIVPAARLAGVAQRLA